MHHDHLSSQHLGDGDVDAQQNVGAVGPPRARFPPAGKCIFPKATQNPALNRDENEEFGRWLIGVAEFYSDALSYN
jgi:hypothetical protein